ILRLSYLCFFFQAEDGIRDDLVTGVQTCALPICRGTPVTLRQLRSFQRFRDFAQGYRCATIAAGATCGPAQIVIAVGVGSDDWRSEERRVGKEVRTRRGGCM